MKEVSTIKKMVDIKMTEWKEYTGSDEQIAEMQEAQYGVLIDGCDEILDVSDMVSLESYMNEQDKHKYLICQPHPLADMICQQARTGQLVLVKFTSAKFVDNDRYEFMSAHKCYSVYVTTRPDWNIPEAKYSFMPFEEEPCK